jgi:hypothetical protein
VVTVSRTLGRTLERELGGLVVAPLFQFGTDVAHGLDDGARAHVQLGITF